MNLVFQIMLLSHNAGRSFDAPRAVATKALVRMKPRRKTAVVRWSLNMCLPAFFMLTAPTLHRLRILLNVAAASLEAATRGLEEAKTEFRRRHPVPKEPYRMIPKKFPRRIFVFSSYFC